MRDPEKFFSDKELLSFALADLVEAENYFRDIAEATFCPGKLIRWTQGEYLQNGSVRRFDRARGRDLGCVVAYNLATGSIRRLELRGLAIDMLRNSQQLPQEWHVRRRNT